VPAAEPVALVALAVAAVLVIHLVMEVLVAAAAAAGRAALAVMAALVAAGEALVLLHPLLIPLAELEVVAEALEMVLHPPFPALAAMVWSF
jgi:hypothetical protein